MSTLTAVLYGALGVYLGGWFLGYWTGNFALLLFTLTVFTFGYWLAERFRFKPAREAAAAALESQDIARRAGLAKMGIDKVDGDVEQAKHKLLAQPWWLDWTAGLFPVILIVFLLRSFLFEPFKIPSGSMIPTLLVGDLILVNKYTYGVRLPVINTKIIDVGDPKRGDVMVFRFPKDPSVDYIKRVVGIPGDTVTFENNRLTINGQAVALRDAGEFYDGDRLVYYRQYSETLGETEHKLLTDLEKPSFVSGAEPFPFRDQCSYSRSGLTCKVPKGHYFMMGDNRENSLDSRYWGFVPEQNIVGRAFFIWMNFGDFGRIGRFQ
jgi:signal peptidase I